MTLLSPLALWWLATLPILFWIWRLAATRHQTTVASLAPFEALLQRTAARRRRLVTNALFWLQLAMILALVGLLARPALVRPAKASSLLVLDTSASLGARMPGGVAMDEARRSAKAWLATQGRGRTVVVTTAPLRPLALEQAPDPALLQQRLDRVEAADLGGDLSTAASLGLALLGAHPGRVAVVTDEPRPDGLAASVRWLHVNTAAPNAGIVSAEGAGPLCGGEAPRLTVAVQNFSQERRVVRVLARQQGRTLADVPAELEAGQRETLAMPLPQEVRGAVAVSLEPEDALMADNEVLVWVADQAAMPVSLVWQDEATRPALQRWLSACEGLPWSDGTPQGDQPYVLVTDRETLPAGGSSAVLYVAHAAGQAAVSASWVIDDRHAITAYLPDTGRMQVPASWAERPPAGRPLAWGIVDGRRVPLAVAHEGEVRAITLVLDPSSDEAAHVVLFFNTLRWLTDRSGSLPAGEPIIVPGVPAGPVRVERPDGDTERLSHEGGALRYERTTRRGLYRIRWDGGGRSIAVNLFDPAESNLLVKPATWRPLADAGAQDQPATPRSVPITRPLLWLLVLVWIAEWWLYCKRAPSPA